MLRRLMGRRLVGVRMQVRPVARQVAQAVDLQAALQATHHRRALVVAEVVAGARAQRDEDVAQHLVGLVPGRRQPRLRRQSLVRLGDRRQVDVARGGAEVDQLARHLRHRQHEVDRRGGDRAARHAVEVGLVGHLREGQAALLLDVRNARRAVGARARQHDADGARAMRLRQRAEEQVDGHVAAARAIGIGDVQRVVVHRQQLARRDHIDVIALDSHRPADMPHRQRRHVLQQRRHIAAVLGRQMQHDDEGHAAVGRQVLEELQQGLEPAGRCADAHHGEVQRAGCRADPRVIRWLGRRRGDVGH